MSAAAGNNVFSVRELLRPDAFPHAVTELKLIETHISWVILTGNHAYKIKKPVQFEFVDYSTLELRRANCLKEVELNCRFAPEIYLGVVPISATDGLLSIGSETIDDRDGKHAAAIEFAVKMKQFPQDSIVASRLEHPELTGQSVDRFGTRVAKFHQSIESANPTIECVQAHCIEKDALENFVTLGEAFQNDGRLPTIEQLQRWTSDQFEQLESTFEQRLHDGLVRRCHGDLHLKNIIQVDSQLKAFDGIEFNEEFQWIDVLSEIAFPVMDFVARGRPDLAWRLLNAYLESSGEYQALDVLRFYLVYRAMVRAKVSWLNPKNQSEEVRQNYATADESQNCMAGPWDKYLKAACYFAFELKPKLAITHGFSGSGKSFHSMKLIEQEGWLRIRSDIERDRLSTKFKTHDKYSEEMSDWVFTHLLELADLTLHAGLPVILDATFLKLKRRTPFLELAQQWNVDFEILTCDAPFEVLCERIRSRESGPSEATIDVLKRQMETHDPLTTDELQYVRRPFDGSVNL
jgi:aminoglycoside phosphotransferase family enzyme/predicted kinase